MYHKNRIVVAINAVNAPNAVPCQRFSVNALNIAGKPMPNIALRNNNCNSSCLFSGYSVFLSILSSIFYVKIKDDDYDKEY